MIRISVITCTYNAADVISRTLESVQRQTYRNVEHLIIDGCSTDGTMKIVENYETVSQTGKDSTRSVRVVSERDKGLYDAMNKGIRWAVGDYIVFLNAGDMFAEDTTLQKVADCVKEDEKLPGVIYGDTDVVDDTGHFIRHRRLSPPEHLTWRDFRNGMLVCHQSFYALSSIARVTPYDLGYRYSADVDWCIRIMKESEKQGRPLRNVRAVVTNYLDGGMSIKNHRASLVERFRVMNRHYGLLQTIMQHCWFVIRAIVKK